MSVNQRNRERNRLPIVVLVLICFSALFFAWIGFLAEEQNPEDVQQVNRVHDIDGDIFDKDSEDVSPQNPTPAAEATIPSPAAVPAGAAADNVCLDICKARTEARVRRFGGDLFDRSALVQIAEKEKQELVSRLHIDYGKDNFENIFVDKEASVEEERYRGKAPAGITGNSTETLKRKLMIKVLSAQVNVAKNDAAATGCDCLHGNAQVAGSVPNTNQMDEPLDSTFEKYVWATGGHSAAAGHGNLYNESYTAYMERDLKPFFSAFGIDFEGRNYAMGGTSSAYEVSMCYEQIFGTDVDFFSWDYGMTDGEDIFKFLHYSYRGALSSGHPGLLAIHHSKKREDPSHQLADLGFPVFLSPGSTEKDIRSAIPDSAGLGDAEIQAMPEYVRNMKCSGQIEVGDPYCGDDKWTKFHCVNRMKRTGWHPGFKVQALEGHLLALFLMQTFVDALKDLSTKQEVDPEILLAQLKEEDDRAHQSFADSPLPASVTGHKDWHEEIADVMELYFKGPSLCRTGRLPAQARYLGHMTKSGKTGEIAILGYETYDTGVEVATVKESATEADEDMVLAYKDNPVERAKNCPVLLKPDYNDFFYACDLQGWVKLTFPYEAEKEAYGYKMSTFKGLLAIHLVVCNWNNCKKEDIREDGIEAGKLEMTVNGKPVKAFKKLGVALVLEGEDGVFWDPSPNEDYEISVRVIIPDMYFRISAIVLH